MAKATTKAERALIEFAQKLLETRAFGSQLQKAGEILAKALAKNGIGSIKEG